MDDNIINPFSLTEYFAEDDIPFAENTDFKLAFLMDDIRTHFQSPIMINRVYDPNSRPTSQHQLIPCTACDFWIKTDLSLLEQFIEISRFKEISAIGVYPHWNNPGFHIDLRAATKRALWQRDEHGNYLNIISWLRGVKNGYN